MLNIINPVQRTLRNRLFLLIFCSLIYLPLAHASITSKIEQRVTHTQHVFPKGNICDVNYVKEIIDIMHQLDQEVREAFTKNPNNAELVRLMKKVDTFNTAKMKEVLTIHGWITISKFGKTYDDKAWLLIQHSDHEPFFQAGVLFLLSSIMDKGETSKIHFAYLYDRVALKFPTLAMKQRYGTQVSIEKNCNIQLLPYEGSLEDIDLRRKELGMEPLAEYLEEGKKFCPK